MEAAASTGPPSMEVWQQMMQARKTAESIRGQLEHWQTVVALLSQKLQRQLAQNEALARENAALYMEASGADLAPGAALCSDSATKDVEFAARFERISANLLAGVNEQVSGAEPRQGPPSAMVPSSSTEHFMPEVPMLQAVAMDMWSGPEVLHPALQTTALKSSALEKEQVSPAESMARNPLHKSFGSCNHAKAEPLLVPTAAAGEAAWALPQQQTLADEPGSTLEQALPSALLPSAASKMQYLALHANPTPWTADAAGSAATSSNQCNQPQDLVALAEEHGSACPVGAFLQGLGSMMPSSWGGSAAPQDMAPAEHAELVKQQQQQQQQQQQPLVKMPGHTLGSKRPLRTLKPDVTTLAVRNIPARYSQQQLLGEWPPDGTYDLLHLPYHTREKRTLGYAFINFPSHSLALEFQQRWHGKFLSEHGRTRALDIASASVQGYWSNLQRFLGRGMDSTVERDHLPATFSGTVRLDTQQELQKLACMQ